MAQIFSNLDPADVLSLSRTSKTLRSTLVNKSAAFVWKRARMNVGLHFCPDDLTEVQYAKLMFDTHCDASLPMSRFSLHSYSIVQQKMHSLSYGPFMLEPRNVLQIRRSVYIRDNYVYIPC